MSSHTNDFHHPRRHDGVKKMIQTSNLQLLPVEGIHVEALLRSKSELAALLQVSVPDGWPHFPEAFSLSAIEAHESNLREADWHNYFNHGVCPHSGSSQLGPRGGSKQHLSLLGNGMHAAHQHIRTGYELPHLPLVGRPIKGTEPCTNRLEPRGVVLVPASQWEKTR